MAAKKIRSIVLKNVWKLNYFVRHLNVQFWYSSGVFHINSFFFLCLFCGYLTLYYFSLFSFLLPISVFIIRLLFFYKNKPEFFKGTKTYNWTLNIKQMLNCEFLYDILIFQNWEILIEENLKFLFRRQV